MKKGYFLLLISLINFSAIAQNCNGWIYYANNPIKRPLLVHYEVGHNALVSNSTFTYAWDFGDGDSSTLVSPSHQYDSSGIYQACVVIKEWQGGSIVCSSSNCEPITISDDAFGSAGNTPCKALFHYRAESAAIPLNFFSAHLENRSQGNTYSSYWDFGNGDVDSVGSTQYLFPSLGTYNVCLTIEDEIGCTDTYCDQVEITPCSNYWQYNSNYPFSNDVFFTVFSATTSLVNKVLSYDFGDGTSLVLNPGSGGNTSHMYAAVGNYDVCLTINDTVTGCISTYCDTVDVQWLRGFELQGQVITTGSNLTFSKVYLIELQGNNLVVVDSVEAFALYTFPNVDTGRYLLKAALLPTDASYNDYMPTYFGDTLFWSDATMFDLYSDTFGIDINMVPGTNPGGPGFVGGNVFQGANKMMAEGDPIARVQVMLLNMDNSGVQYNYSDANGDYAFSNVAYGTYQVYAEVLGKPTYPLSVTLDANNESVDNANIVVTDAAVYVGVSPTPDFLESLVLYPNPTHDLLNIKLSIGQQDELTLNIINLHGMVVGTYRQDVELGSNNIAIDMLSLSQGIYFVQLVNTKGESATYKIVRE